MKKFNRFAIATLLLLVASSVDAQVRRDVVDLSSLRAQVGDSMVVVPDSVMVNGHFVMSRVYNLHRISSVSTSPVLAATNSRRQAVRHPEPAIEPAPFVVAVAVTPAVGGGFQLVVHFGDVPNGTLVQRRVWSSASNVPVIDVKSTINVLGVTDPNSLWWGLVHEGPIPVDWQYCELLVTEPGKLTKRAFVTFPVGLGGAGKVATIDVGGGIHLDGFYLHRPVVVASYANIALKSEGADYNYFPPTSLSEVYVHVGTLLTICSRVNENVNNRQCGTGPVEAQ